MSSPLVARRDSLRVGVISDVHSNPHALRRALAVLQRVAADRVVCLGDVVEKGPQPNAVCQILARWTIPTVMGNHDENAVRHARLDPDAGGLSRSSLGWLATLPARRDYLWVGRHVTLAHASLVGNGVGVGPGSVPKRMRRALRQCDADVVLLGHTHVPMRLRFEDRWLFNPGSIALDRSGVGPTCAVLSLPSMTFELYRVDTGERIPWDDHAQGPG